ncbi:outer membrane protein [Hoeflea sp.]|uniref:outer membrane protein n=1 Tax=Hoeflea sp. TaxID=1940281 RepID=UPI0019C07EFB|nr:outer membrane protein [Hoeflea sp.]MBC7282157.1 porin family protein [Hoeflea sp.]
MKKLLIAAALIFASTSAFAADPVPYEPTPVAEAPVVYDWTGLYAGGSIGYGWGDTDWVYTLGGATAHHSTDGLIGGVQAGYNWQMQNIVLGAELDILASGINGSTACPNPAFACESEIDWLGTARVRAGFAANNWLFYGTGGVAAGDVTIQTVNPALAVPVNGSSETLVGWAAGAGVEWGFLPNASIKAEYMYYDLGDDIFTVDAGLGVNAGVSLHTTKIGLNWRF